MSLDLEEQSPEGLFPFDQNGKENWNMKTAFELGHLMATRGITDRMNEDPVFGYFVFESLIKYIECNWGDTCEEDAAMNNDAVANGDRILAVYKRSATDETIWIVTEWDRSATTVLFPDEY